MAANLQRSKRSGAKLVLCTFSTICTADNQPPRPQCWSQGTTYASVWEFQTCRYTSPCASKITIEVQSTPSKMSHLCFSSFQGFPIYLEVAVEKALNQFSCDLANHITCCYDTVANKVVRKIQCFTWAVFVCFDYIQDIRADFLPSPFTRLVGIWVIQFCAKYFCWRVNRREEEWPKQGNVVGQPDFRILDVG